MHSKKLILGLVTLFIILSLLVSASTTTHTAVFVRSNMTINGSYLNVTTGVIYGNISGVNSVPTSAITGLDSSNIDSLDANKTQNTPAECPGNTSMTRYEGANSTCVDYWINALGDTWGGDMNAGGYKLTGLGNVSIESNGLAIAPEAGNPAISVQNIGVAPTTVCYTFRVPQPRRGASLDQPDRYTRAGNCNLQCAAS